VITFLQIKRTLGLNSSSLDWITKDELLIFQNFESSFYLEKNDFYFMHRIKGEVFFSLKKEGKAYTLYGK
jgi:hypothetical protein